jgi:hypothetical protein
VAKRAEATSPIALSYFETSYETVCLERFQRRLFGSLAEVATDSSWPILLKNSLFAWRSFERQRDRQSIGEENERGERPWPLCGEAFCFFQHGWYQPLGHSPQILCSRRHQKLIVRPMQTSQTQSIQPQDAFEVSKQHLDLLAFAA